MNSTLLILAAGMGSRYGGLKQIEGFGPNGEALFDYNLYDAIKAGFKRAVFVIREEHRDIFNRHLGNKYKGRIEIEFAYQKLTTAIAGVDINPARKKPWGTGQAVLAARDKISGPFVMINADDYYGPQAYADASAFMQRQNGYFIVGYRLEDTLSDNGPVNRGWLESDANGRLVAMRELFGLEKRNGRIIHVVDGEERELASGEHLVSMNMIGFPNQVFAAFTSRLQTFMAAHKDELKAEFLVPTELNDMMNSGEIEIQVIPTHSHWFGVTYQEDGTTARAEIRAAIARGIYPHQLF
jgi:NDP-sugar pyrophosphorylase family protein